MQTKSNANDLKGIWKTIKLASNMAPTGNPQNVDKTANLNADEFNEHFTNVGPTLQSKIPIHDNASFTDFLSPIEGVQIMTLIQCLNRVLWTILNLSKIVNQCLVVSQ